jgi:uncharacterized protein YkwD
MLLRRLLVLSALVAITFTLPVPAGAGARTDAEFVRVTNADRAEEGLGRLRVSATLSTLARRQSVRMAQKSARYFRGRCHRRALWHNDISGVSDSWSWVGQNVGCGSAQGGRVGPAVRDIQAAFLASDHHRRNILYRRANRIGVGTYISRGVVWVTVNFMQVR